jgi:hypothetical protein
MVISSTTEQTERARCVSDSVHEILQARTKVVKVLSVLSSTFVSHVFSFIVISFSVRNERNCFWKGLNLWFIFSPP